MVCWPIPEGFDGLSGAAYLGYAHGAAGIADVLLDLYEATDEPVFRRTALAAARWLASQALPALADGSGVAWPAESGGAAFAPMWCHGAAGIGRFFLHAARLDLLPGALDLARRAGRAVALGSRWANPTQCHGLAGNVEFLLDLARVTRDPADTAAAHDLGRLLDAWGVERDGRLVWPSEATTVVTPDFMVGYAGVAPVLLRLADPGRPALLSRTGFRYRARALPAGHAAPCR
jgi:lantibiotic modifying enzyme